MPIPFPENVQSVLADLQPLVDIEAIQLLTDVVMPLCDSLVQEVLEPMQSLDVTKTELKDLYLLLTDNKEKLAQVSYGEVDLQRFRNAIVAFLTYQGLYSETTSLGEYKARPVEEVVGDSLPWRDKLRTKANQAFFFDAIRNAPYQDHNESGSIEEEVSDLRSLVASARKDKEELKKVDFVAFDIAEGERLLNEAEGRDVLALVGIRSLADLKIKRDRALTLAVLLGRYARLSGISAFWNDPEQRAKFERVSFRNAMRRLKRRRKSTVAEPQSEAPVDATETTDNGDAVE
jgi:hypothetical protein